MAVKAENSRAVVERHQFADYLNIGTPELAKWVLMGTGFTVLDEEFGAESESAKYVNEASESSTVTKYKSVFPFEAHLIRSQEAINTLYHVGRNRLTGADAEFEYVRVELWDQKKSMEQPVANTFAARKFIVSVECSDITGESKQTLTGNLNAGGDPVDGFFNTQEKTFEEAGADA